MTKLTRMLVAVGFTLSASFGCASPTEDESTDDAEDALTSSPVTLPGYTLVFQDEFAGTTLDRTKWVTYDGPQANAPKFTKFDSKDVAVSNGLLHLKIEKSGKAIPYTAGGLEVLPKYTYAYGRWVVRARFPKGKGNVGYVGLFGKTITEIDFAEVGSKYPTINTFTQHSGKEDRQDQKQWRGDTTVFHEFAVDWEPGVLHWYVDGKLQYTVPQRFTKEALLLAMGAWVADCKQDWGCPDKDNVYPASMDVDYVRIYKKNAK